MESTTKMTPKDFFLHLGVVVALYVSTVAFISFVFSIINIALPMPTDAYYEVAGARSSIAWSLSVFIVVYPVFVYLLFMVSQYFSKHAEKAQVAIRKWFIYLTIFVTAVTIIIDAIVLLTTFLQGEQLTTRFLLKVLTIIIVALTIFWFSVRDLQGKFVTQVKTLKKATWITSIVVLIMIVVGFVVMGSPQQARQALEDDTRVNDLSMIQNEVVEHWRMTGTLPADLSVLNDPIRYVSIPVDPVTGESYEYQQVSDTSFELCATFATASEETSRAQKQMYYYEFAGDDAYFTHDAERTCFERTIDPSRTPRYDATL